MLRYNERGALNINQGSSPWPHYAPRQARFAGQVFGDEAYIPADNQQALVGQDRADAYAAMITAVSQVRDAIAVAQTRVVLTPTTSQSIVASAILPFLAPFIGDSAPADVQTSVMNGLTSMSHILDMREADIVAVLDGRLDPRRWYRALQAVSDGVASILGELQENSTANLMQASVTDTQSVVNAVYARAQQVVQVVANTAENVAIGLGIGSVVLLIGAGLLLWPIAKQVLLSYIPQGPHRQHLDGYRRHRRLKAH